MAQQRGATTTLQRKNSNSLFCLIFVFFTFKFPFLQSLTLQRQTRNGFSTREDSISKTVKWVIDGSDLLYLNRARENSDDAMAADTGLLFKAVLGHPAKIRVGYSLNAMIEHSPQRKEAIITAYLQHQQQQHKETEEEQEQEEYRDLFE